MTTSSNSPDVAVIGAGVFGAWIAYLLRQSGQSVALFDAHGAGHTRASSGGESRLIRMGYGDAELYTRWAAQSLTSWTALFTAKQQPLLHGTGVLWLARPDDAQMRATLVTLQRLKIQFERLDGDELVRRYPQMRLDDMAWGVLEPESGVLMARRAVQTVVDAAIALGVEYRIADVMPPTDAHWPSLATTDGERVSADTYVFACGGWLPKVFPRLLGERIILTRQEVFYFGCPAGNRNFAPPQLPAWIDFGKEVYGMPDLAGRGLKVGIDRHGPSFDPDTDDRHVSPEQLRMARDFLQLRFPSLGDAPLLETRVCQYENTSNGEFLIDRHPNYANVWLVGGGSGHGFKHGPAVGEYVAKRIVDGGPVSSRFALASKATVQQRTVF